MYWWKHFDAGEVRDEFAQIAGWGMRLVRICLLWEDFQPRFEYIRRETLDDLSTVLDAANDCGLKVMVTLFVGNMSGAMWFPRWAFSDLTAPVRRLQLAAGQPTHHVLRDLYAEPAMLRAEVRLASAVARHLRSHPALWGWDLANEIDAALEPRTDDEGWLWTCLLASVLHSSDPSHPVTYGAHPPSLDSHNHLRIDDIAPSLDLLSMHGYPLYSDVAEGPLDPEFVPFVTMLTAALGGKATWMQEFGVCTAPPGQPSQTIEDDFLGTRRPQFLASEADAAAYYDAVLTRLHALRVPGVLAWCYADYTSNLWDRPPFDRAIRERTFGLVRADGSEKPAVDVLKHHIEAPPPPEAPLPDVLGELTARDYYLDPKRQFVECYARWRAARATNR
jgi:endo-1,4-beta-mannosidase